MDSWQSALQQLTTKAKGDSLIRSVANAQTFEGKVRKVLDSIAIRSKIASWISHCSESRYQKSGGTASKLRDEGNSKFSIRDYEGCLRLYTESVICAPEIGPELSLAFGNRSAALYHLGRYSECLKDIDLAFKYRYPKNLEYKLYQRRGQCYTKRGDYKDAKDALQKAIDALEFVPKLKPGQKESMTRDLHALQTESESLSAQRSRKSSTSSFGPPHIPTYGSNPTFHSASNTIEVRSTKAKGRHVVAKQELHVGDVLFSELPYASVLLPEHYSSHCHNCFKKFLAPVPCLKCTQPRFCSDDCRQEAWESFHQFECGGLELLHSVGIAHLAVRTVLVCGHQHLRSLSPWIRKELDLPVDPLNRYPEVFSLVTHIKDLHPEDLFQYTVTAALLTMFLEKRTKFFSDGGFNHENPDDDDNVAFIGGVMLRHIAQLICNASAIFEVGAEAEESSEAVYNNSQYRIATAIYPSASMMNHACNPSVINSFHNNRLIVRAIEAVPEGGEIFNCYGPHCKRARTSDRMQMLKEQYHFVCQCTACKDKKSDEFLDGFNQLRCVNCGGPVKMTEEKSEKCSECGEKNNDYSQIEACCTSLVQFNQGTEYMRRGQVIEAIGCFKSCYNLRAKVMLKNSQDITEAADSLAKAFAMNGMYVESANCLQEACLPAIEERFGGHSIELGHELLKYGEILAEAVQQNAEDINPSAAKSALERAATIFEMHYGSWHRTYQEVLAKLERLA